MSLTEEGIGEPVPLAAVLSDEPPPVQTRSKTEGCPESADEDVAQTDVQQDQVDGRPERAKLCEDEQREEVVEDPRHQDEAEAYCHQRVAGPAQPAGVLGRRGVPQGGVGAEAGAGQGAVCGAEIATAYVDDHSSERRADARGGKHESCAAPAQQLHTLRGPM